MFSLSARLLFLAGVGALATAVGVLTADRYAPRGTLPGLRVGGVELPARAEARAFVSARASELLARPVRLRVLGEDGTEVATETGSLEKLGVAVDERAVVDRIRALRDDGDLLERADLAARALAGRIEVPLPLSIDASAAWPVLLHLKDVSDRAPVSARVDLARRAVIPEKEGAYVDPYAAVAQILAAARDASVSVVTLAVTPFPARHQRADLESLRVDAVLGEYDTYFSRRGDQERRGANIDVAARKVDGLVLLPGEITSFNDVVGERSVDNGFAKSWEIYKGEMVEGVGGGTCQVASTFYAASFFGGLDVLERLPHSRPSAYIPMGLDATVVYPIVDLKVRNPYDFPVVMHAQVDGNRLRMQLVGQKKLARVSFSRELLESYPYRRKVTEEKKLTWSKRVVLKQHGIRGYKVKRVRTLAYADGRYRKETNTDLYPPTNEVYEVPPGFDVSLLPPLPEEDEDEGEGSDTGADAASAAATAPALPDAITLADGTRLGVESAPSAHTPTKAQVSPEKIVKLSR